MGKNTWRPDRYSPCPRNQAGRYLAFLASLGYQLSDIEQVVAGGASYAGDTPGRPDPARPATASSDGQDGVARG